jgi:iron complex outermembrane receptor protein
MKLIKSRLLLLAAGALAPAAFVHGQTTATPPAQNTDTVQLSPFTVTSDADEGYYSPESVSATRTRTELINLPVNLAVFNENFIEDIAARDLIDVVGFAAGVSQGSGGGSDTSNGDTLGFTLRGQAGFVPYRNGFRRLRLVDPVTISRVEIVKGPSSVLYGLAFPGGMVNYLTKRPVQRKITSVNLRVGSYDFYKGSFDYNQPLLDKKLAFRLVASREDSKNWADRHHAKTTALYPSLTWWIRPTTTLTVEFENTKRHIKSPRSGLPFNSTLNLLAQGWPLDHSWNSRAPGDYLNTDMTGYTAEFIHQFNSHFTLRTNYTRTVWQDDTRFNTSPVGIPSADNPILPARAFSRGKRGSWDEYAQAELVNNFSFKGIEVQTIVGYQHGDEEFRNKLNLLPAPTTGVRWDLRDRSTWILTEQTEADSPGIASNTGTRVGNLLNTLYVTNQLSLFNGRLRTLLGYRSDRLRSNTLVGATGERVVSWAEPSETPQFGVLYKVLDGLSVYGQYSESLVNLYTGQQRRPDGSFFTPVPGTGEGYDIGVKAEMMQGRIAGNLSVFRVDNANIIRQLPNITLPDGTLITPAEQSGTDRSTGFEMDLRLRPLKGTQVVLAYANTDAYVLSDRSNSASVVIDGVRQYTREGHRLSNAPVHTVSVWARQDLGSLGALEKTYVAGGGRFLSKRAFTESFNNIGGVLTPPPDMGSYKTVDVSFGGEMTVKGTRYRGAISAKNVFDETYLLHRWAFGAPRTFEFSLTASF